MDHHIPKNIHKNKAAANHQQTSSALSSSINPTIPTRSNYNSADVQRSSDSHNHGQIIITTDSHTVKATAFEEQQNQMQMSPFVSANNKKSSKVIYKSKRAKESNRGNPNGTNARVNTFDNRDPNLQGYKK